jgi:hypothetical protein
LFQRRLHHCAQPREAATRDRQVPLSGHVFTESETRGVDNFQNLG